MLALGAIAGNATTHSGCQTVVNSCNICWNPNKPAMFTSLKRLRNNCNWTNFPWNVVVSNMWLIQFQSELVSVSPIDYLILWLSTLLLWVLSVEALSNRSGPVAVISFGKIPQGWSDCRIITTCVLNAIFFLFSHVIVSIMPRNLANYVLWQIVCSHRAILSVSGESSGCDARMRHNRE